MPNTLKNCEEALDNFIMKSLDAKKTNEHVIQDFQHLDKILEEYQQFGVVNDKKDNGQSEE